MSEIISKGLKELKELLENELSAWGDMCWEIAETDDDHWEVKIYQEKGGKSTCVYFKFEEAKLFVDYHEDSWHEVDWYTPNVRHFWMAFMEWPFK